MIEGAQNLTPKKRPRWAKGFLAALRDSGNVRLSCEAVGISRRTAYDLREDDDTFFAEWEQALEESADLLEQEARRRAHEGVRRLKFDRGKPIMVPVVGNDGLVVKGEDGKLEMVPYVEHEYSDTLMIFLLKGARPEKYRERTDVRQTSANIQIDWDQVPGPIRDAFIEGRISLHDVLSQLRTTRT